MRIKEEISEFIKDSVKVVLGNADVYLFGSRVHDHLKGGDIDILILGEKSLSGQEKRDIKIAIKKRFGEQKIDIISYEKNEISNFKDLALEDAVKL